MFSLFAFVYLGGSVFSSFGRRMFLPLWWKTADKSRTEQFGGFVASMKLNKYQSNVCACSFVKINTNFKQELP